MHTNRQIRVEDGLLAQVLAPYVERCRYLREAVAEFPDASGKEECAPPARCTGRFAIPETFYIQDTGHFNAVEFNICYNQIIYTLMAQCVVSDVTEYFGAMDLDEYFRRQLPDVLIHEFSSKFKRPMLSASFQGEVTIDELRRRRGFCLLKTRVRFWDESGGESQGAVSLAIVNREAEAAEAPSRSRTAGEG